MKKQENIVFTKFKRIIMKFISPIRTQTKSALIINSFWLLLAATCFVGGIILGAAVDFLDVTSSFMYAFDVWAILSLVCIIPFAPTFIAYLVKTTRSAVRMGKNIEYTETTVDEVKPHSGVYRVSTETKNLGGIFGWAWSIISTVFLMAFFVFVGVPFLIARFILTIKEIKNCICATRRNENPAANI